MSALTWITKEAKHLRRKYPKRFKTWREYVAQASAIYASKHKGKSPVGKKRKKPRTITGKKKSKPRKANRRVGAGITTKSKTHTDYNRQPVNIQIGRIRKKRHTKWGVVHKHKRRVAGTGGTGTNLMPLLMIGGLGLLAYAVLKKPTAPAYYPNLYPTGNTYRDTTSQKILSYATAVGLGIDSITKLINALNTASDSQVQTINDSIDSGQGIPDYYIA